MYSSAYTAQGRSAHVAPSSHATRLVTIRFRHKKVAEILATAGDLVLCRQHRGTLNVLRYAEATAISGDFSDTFRQLRLLREASQVNVHVHCIYRYTTCIYCTQVWRLYTHVHVDVRANLNDREQYFKSTPETLLQ